MNNDNYTSLPAQLENFSINVNNDLSIIDFEQKKKQIQMISDRLAEIEVTEENIKESKKLLARVRKAVKSLDNYRKEKKRDILKPYEVLAHEIKELMGIIDQGEDAVNEQIIQLETKEKEQKNKEIQALFEKKVVPYSLLRGVDYDHFYDYSYLNKSYSMNKIEKEMGAWLKKTNSDLQIIKDNAEELNLIYEQIKHDYFHEWDCDLYKAINFFNEKRKQDKTEQEKVIIKTEIEQLKQSDDKQTISTTPPYRLIAIHDDDYPLVRTVLETNNLNYISGKELLEIVDFLIKNERDLIRK